MLLPTVMQWEPRDFGLHTFEVYLGESRERSVALWIRSTDELGRDPASDENA